MHGTPATVRVLARSVTAPPGDDVMEQIVERRGECG